MFYLLKPYIKVAFLFEIFLSGIGSDSKKELKRFEFDTRSLTSFELANKLWDAIGDVCDQTTVAIV
jgi:hypothetical protein